MKSCRGVSAKCGLGVEVCGGTIATDPCERGTILVGGVASFAVILRLDADRRFTRDNQVILGRPLAHRGADPALNGVKSHKCSMNDGEFGYYSLNAGDDAQGDQMPNDEAIDKRNKPETRRGEAADIFIANSMFPDAAAVFTSRPGSLMEAKDTACIVLDTNALLVPYGIGARTMSEVEGTYQRLLKEKRLAV